MSLSSKLAHAKMEISDGFTWLSELAKIDIPEEVTEDSPTRKVITRYTPLGKNIGSQKLGRKAKFVQVLWLL